MINLDGSHGEGGGQMLRSALCLSMLSGKAFCIDRIREGRSEPGLKSQHLACVKLAKELCDAVVEGDEIGSQKLSFYPRALKSRTIALDIGTAGSLTLLLQTALPALLCGTGKSRLKLTGGTDVSHSPSIDYLANVLLPHLRRYAHLELSIERRGFYPKGGGSIELLIKPFFTKSADTSLERFRESKAAMPLTLIERGPLLAVRGISFASKELEEQQVAQRQASAARRALGMLDVPVKIDAHYGQSASIGTSVTLWATYGTSELAPVILGSCALGAPGKRAEAVGDEAAASLIAQMRSHGCVDEHLGDQLMVIMAIFGGSIRLAKMTDHARSNRYVIEAFLGPIFKLDETESVLSC